jgi:hypothetical protein
MLPVGPAASTTDVEEDVDGRLPGGRYWRVQQRPPPRLKKTSMADHLGGAADGSIASTTDVEEDIDGMPPRGALPTGLAVATTEVEGDVDDGPPTGISIPSCVLTHISSYKTKHGKQ